MSALDLEAKRAAARAAKREQPKLGEIRTYYGILGRDDGETVVDYERGSSARIVDELGSVVRIERDPYRVCPANVGERIMLLGPISAGADAVAIAEILRIERDGMRVVVRRVSDAGGKVPLGKITIWRCDGAVEL